MCLQEDLGVMEASIRNSEESEGNQTMSNRTRVLAGRLWQCNVWMCDSCTGRLKPLERKSWNFHARHGMREFNACGLRFGSWFGLIVPSYFLISPLWNGNVSFYHYVLAVNDFLVYFYTSTAEFSLSIRWQFGLELLSHFGSVTTGHSSKWVTGIFHVEMNEHFWDLGRCALLLVWNVQK